MITVSKTRPPSIERVMEEKRSERESRNGPAKCAGRGRYGNDLFISDTADFVRARVLLYHY